MYSTPSANGGQGTPSVTCSPAPGTTFPVGVTPVTCTATDELSRSATCVFTVTVSRVPTLSVTKFMAFGDSITAGEVTFPTGEAAETGRKLVVVPTASYPAVLRSLLAERYSEQASSIVLTNEGVPGEPAQGSATLARLTSLLSSQHPEVVLLMEGYNGIGDPTQLAATAKAVDRMAAEARGRGARVFLATLAPSRPGFRAIPLSSIQAFNDLLRDVARGEQAVLVDVYSALLPDVNNSIGADGLHPTESGYRKIAETFFTAIREHLEAR